MAAPVRSRTQNLRSASAEEPQLGIPIGVAALLYFGLALIYFLPALLPGRHIFGTDYFAGGYFFYDFISDRLSSGSLPKWVPYIFGGLPLFANPGSTYYPVHFFADLVFPTERVFPLVFIFQFGMAGLGMYLLAGELGARRWVAFLAGLMFQFTGITMSAVYAGHDGRIIVATLAPLLFFFLHRGIRTGAVAPFAGAAATTGFFLLSFQIQSAYYLLLAAAAWAIFLLVHHGHFRDSAGLLRRVGLGLAAVAFGFAMAAVNFLPFIDYVPASPRGGEGGRGYEYSTSWSMPPAELGALAVPEHSGASIQNPKTGAPALGEYRGANPFKLHTEYVGATVLALLVLGAAFARRDRRWWFFAGLTVFVLLIAFGGHTPAYRLFYEVLPGTKRFRAPSISFFLVSFSLVAMAAITLERLAEQRDAAHNAPRGRGVDGDEQKLLIWLAAGSVGFVVLWMMLSLGDNPAAATGFGRFLFFLVAVLVALVVWARGGMGSRAAAIVLALLTIGDLWIVARPFFQTAPPPEETFAADDVVQFIRSQPQPARVWILPFPAGQVYRGSGDYLMHFGIDQAGGEHPNPLQRWYEYVGAGKESYTDWHNFLEIPAFRHGANIRYIISGVPLEAPELREVHRGSALIYEDTAALPRAYLVPEVRVVGEAAAVEVMRGAEFDPRRTALLAEAPAVAFSGEPLAGSAEVTEYTPDRVVVQTQANRPAMLVLADNYYPGWRATIGGAAVPILRANHTFRGVTVPAGTHNVVFEFVPTSLRTGFAIYVATLLLLAGYAIYAVMHRRRD
ncbi:YfhO family protein [soil metagenome]